MLLSRSLARVGWIQCRGLSGRGNIDRAVAYYNDLIGIPEVTAAKRDVISCESALSDAQQQRRQKQFELRKLQTRLKDIHGELDRTPRGSDRRCESNQLLDSDRPKYSKRKINDF
ncbi:hypothetical protein M3Y94_01172700 [Aphelenchoides besseyi]|nr:hypothetical protein M3Y94_01172700 [Aphelenchoides besseyi]